MPSLRTTASCACGHTPSSTEDADYSRFRDAVAGGLSNRPSPNSALYHTTAQGKLFKVFLNAIPASYRQHYNCNECRSFLDRYGDLVWLTHDRVMPVFFTYNSPLFMLPWFQAAWNKLAGTLSRATLTDPFVTHDKTLGTAAAGGFNHFAAPVPLHLRWYSPTMSAEQRIAEIKADTDTLSTAVSRWPLTTLIKARTLLVDPRVQNAVKVAPMAQWFETVKRSNYPHAIQLAAATAPTGFCHIQSSVLGSLLADISDGVSDTECIYRLNERLDPLNYRRPKAAPKAGTINTAERLFAQLGLATALPRRVMGLGEAGPLTLWTPANAGRRQRDVFGHLRTKACTGGGVPRMTWKRFERTMLPRVTHMQVYVSSDAQSFLAYTVPSNRGAPQLFQWQLDGRDIGYYVYPDGSTPSQWSLRSGWIDVTAVAGCPPVMAGLSNFTDFRTLLLDGARETQNPALDLFPERLRSDLHSVRSVIEAHAQSQALTKPAGVHAAGLCLSEHSVSGRLTLLVQLQGKVSPEHVEIEMFD